MVEQHAAFVGTVPPNYDRYLVPILFHHLRRRPGRPAAGLARDAGAGGRLRNRNRHRAPPGAPRGTGHPGRHRPQPGDDRPRAHADRGRPSARVAPGGRDEPALRRIAPSTSWSASSGSCSSPTRRRACGRRTGCSAPGGLLPLQRLGPRSSGTPSSGSRTRPSARSFRTIPPRFYETPFSLHDTAVVRGLLDAAGFVDVEWRHRREGRARVHRPLTRPSG